MQPFVSQAWLSDRLACGDDIVLADVRWYLDGRPGREAFETGHLPGAVYIDLDEDLAGPGDGGQGRHPLPGPRDFAAAMGRAGVGRRSTVIGYDDAGGVIAARLVWMLRALGVRAALLDGGITAWRGAWESGPVSPPDPVVFEPQPWPRARLADLADLPAAGLVLDARPARRYRGEGTDIDRRAGHIPGAVNLPCRDNVDGQGLLLDRQILTRRVETAGVTPDLVRGGAVVSSCGSGVTACHTLLLLEHLGFGTARLYPGSWSQYAATDLPVVTGPHPRG